MNIVTSYDYPPIPNREWDWSAIDQDTYDGAPDAGPQCVGRGATEREAINDLVEQIEAAAYEQGKRSRATYVQDALAEMDKIYATKGPEVALDFIRVALGRSGEITPHDLVWAREKALELHQPFSGPKETER